MSLFIEETKKAKESLHREVSYSHGLQYNIPRLLLKYGFFKKLLHYKCSSCQLTIFSHQNMVSYLLHPPDFDDRKWSTDKRCIRNEVTSLKIHTLAVKLGTLAMKNFLVFVDCRSSKVSCILLPWLTIKKVLCISLAFYQNRREATKSLFLTWCCCQFQFTEILVWFVVLPFAVLLI